METNTCPEHGEQEVRRTSVTEGVDPYGVDYLACGHRVACFGPGEENVILMPPKARPKALPRRR